MSIQYSDMMVDQHIAPNVSIFTYADIPDMSESEKESPYWVQNFFLNSIFVTFKPPMNAYAYNFLRRVQAAFSQHDLARKNTLLFLEKKTSPLLYSNALFYWENFLSQSWHAYNILGKSFSEKIYEKGDNSIEERLNDFYNAMKHTESRIDEGRMIEGATVPVWLINEGLESKDGKLTYEETGAVLKHLAFWANALMNPKTAKETSMNASIRIYAGCPPTRA